MFKLCQQVPVQGGRGYGRGGLVEVEGGAVWGGRGGVYSLDEANSKWNRMFGSVKHWATLAVYQGELVRIGGDKDNGCSKEIEVSRVYVLVLVYLECMYWVDVLVLVYLGCMYRCWCI